MHVSQNVVDDEKAHNYPSYILFCPRNCKYLRNNLNIFCTSVYALMSLSHIHLHTHSHTHTYTFVHREHWKINVNFTN